MNVVIVHHYDDNLGDSLVASCFQALLGVVLENVGVDPGGCTFSLMALKHPDSDMVGTADLVCFAGGGLFGRSYLAFDGPLRQIIGVTEEKGIPVIFSSMGVNDMDSDEDSRDEEWVLASPCVKAFSVRERLEWFERRNLTHRLGIDLVCDR